MEKFTGFKRDTFVFRDDSGFLWSLNKTVDGSQYYKCFDPKCGVTCVVKNGNVSQRKPHSHAPDRIQEDHLRFLAKIRHLAATTSKDFKDIFSVSQAEHEDGALVAGSYHQNIRIMQGARWETTPSIPKRLLELDEEMKKPE